MQLDPNERRIVLYFIPRRGRPRGRAARAVAPTPAEVQVARLLRANQIVWFIVGCIVALVLLRFALLILGANMDTGFGALMLTITQPLVASFLPLFGEQHARAGLPT